MLKTRATHWILAVALCTGTVGVGCGGGDDETGETGVAGAGGGSAGKGGTAGKGGAGGAGTGGTAGKGGSGGAGTGGTAGKGGSGGGGTGGTAGKGGAGGGGTGGTAGKGGAGGGGTGGGGTGGTAGKGGAGGGGTGGTGGTAGKGGAGAGGAGNGGTGGAGNGPVASVTATKVDFGNADCGGAAPGNQTVTIKNTGAADLKITASVSGASGFAIVGNGAITIPAGQSGTITVSATAVAGSATAGATIQGTLTLATNDPNNASIKLPITETPHGATLSWVTPASGAADFGQQSVGKTSTTPLTLKNTGNADVQVAFGAPTSADFAVAPASGTVAAGATFANLTASFTPASTGSASATSAIKTTGAICGTSASSLSLKGEGVKGTVTVSTSALDFGKNPCGGAAAAPQKITLTNGGTGAFSFTAANTNAAAYTIDPASGTVAAGATADITVTPAGIPFPSAVPGNYGDTITITTDIAGDTPKTVTVTEQALGAIVTANPTSVIFPGVPVNSTTTTTLSLQNVGNADAFLALGLDAGGVGGPIFGVTPATLTVGAGSTQGASVSFAPADNAQQLGGVTLGVDAGAAETVLCQPLPPTVSLSGTGLNGGLGLDKSNIDFQQVPCGTKGTTQQLTLTNVGNAAFDFTGSLQGADASFFQIDTPTGTLAPGASITVNVSANQLAQFPTGGIAPYKASLVLNSTIIGAQPVSVPITLTPSGAILAWGPPNPLDFGNVPASKSSTKDATLVNSGNAPANVTYQTASDPEFTAPSGGTAAVGNTAVPVKFAATTPAGVKTAKLAVSTSDVLCAAPPADLTLTGTSTLGAYSDNGTNWFFGNDSQPGGLGGVGYKFCGTQAQPNTLKICNGGTADFTLTSLTLGTGGFYTATPSSNTVPANGGCVNVTLASNPIPFPLPVDAQGNYVFAFNDTLTVTTDIPLDTPHVYTLNQTAFGAIVNKMSPTALAFADTQVSTQSTFQYLLKNVGNARANLTFALANAPSPWFSLPSINNFAPGQQSFTATFTPTNAQSYADTASLVVGANTVLCDVLPPNTQNNGISLSGKGVPAGAGVFSLSPSAWTFGSVSIEDPAAAVGVYCGSGASADSHVFTISNSTVAAAGYTASVTGGYGLSSTSGTVGAGAQTQITVSTPAIGTNTTPGTHKDGVLSIVVGGNTYTATLTTVTAGTVFRWTDANGANTVVIPLAAAGIANGKTFNMVNDGNAEIDYFIDWGNTGGQVNRGSLWFYPYGPPGINNFQITQAAGSSIGDYVYAANDPGIIVGAIRPNPINKGVICNTNFQELAVVKN